MRKTILSLSFILAASIGFTHPVQSDLQSDDGIEYKDLRSCK